MKKKKSSIKMNAWRKAMFVLCMTTLGIFAAFAGNREEEKISINSNPETGLDVKVEIIDQQSSKRKRPSWIGLKGRALSVDKSDGTIYVIFRVTYTNNNEDGRIVTAIYDKTLNVKGNLSWRKEGLFGGSIECNFSIKIGEAARLELYPGESITVKYPLNVKNAEGERIATYFDLLRRDEYEVTYESTGWTHDFRVRSEE